MVWLMFSFPIKQNADQSEDAFKGETLRCLVLGPTHHSGIILIYCSLFIYKNPMHNIVGSKMTVIKYGWEVK